MDSFFKPAQNPDAATENLVKGARGEFAPPKKTWQSSAQAKHLAKAKQDDGKAKGGADTGQQGQAKGQREENKHEGDAAIAGAGKEGVKGARGFPGGIDQAGEGVG
tara:strand:- start:455 stop:772 length:318 start_codon:yes stop_codon:yes gene_type:complete